MNRPGHNFPPVDQLPIPENVQPGPGWTDQMREMADHIGAYPTMLIVDRYGDYLVVQTLSQGVDRLLPGMI